MSIPVRNHDRTQNAETEFYWNFARMTPEQQRANFERYTPDYTNPAVCYNIWYDLLLESWSQRTARPHAKGAHSFK